MKGRVMPNKGTYTERSKHDAGKAPKETWHDWFPNVGQDEEGTIDDLLGFLALKKRPDVSVDNIRYWQKAGVIPSPLRRWHQGATRAIYPTRLAGYVILDLLKLQELGYTLQQITDRLRALGASMYGKDDAPGVQDVILEAAHTYADITKRPISFVSINFYDTDGCEYQYAYHVPPTGSDET